MMRAGRASAASWLRPCASCLRRLARLLSYPLPAARAAAERPQPAAAALQLDAASPWADRLALAATVGAWVRSVLDGAAPSALGPSGRERQTLRSRVWVCFADRDGRRLQPVVVADRWQALLDAVAAHQEQPRVAALAAVTIGWPSEREARACVSAAGCTWPQRRLL